jgi:2-polyprenyl-6-methoxyphenol hydroxylase-like FAD-dependent oxidoreductase
MDTDVLIVGAGPTGLMLANQLARRGVRALIVDRHSGPAQQSRAMAVHARTLEIYAKLGVAQRAHELGTLGTAASLWSGGRRGARIPLGEIGRGLSPFPYVLMLGQDANERILGDRLHEFGISVQWNTELVTLQQHADRVDVALKQPDGSTRTLSAGWVAGCDGARSAVRRLNGIEFPGAPYEHVFFVADTEARGPMTPNELNAYLFRDGFHLFFPMHGRDRWRVIGILPKELRQREDLSFDAIVPTLAREVGAGLSFAECSWFSTYRIHHRSAERFRDGRCFLLGDAAHIHSPAGGQGMNTGLQDAYNLAWKLALVVGGRADAALLDSYAAERMPVARRLLQTTDRAFSMVVSDSWVASLLRTRLIAKLAAFAMTIGRAREAAFRTLSQIGIRYRGSPLSQTLAGVPERAPQAGDRFPWLKLRFEAGGPLVDLYERLDDTRFNLLVFGQPGATSPLPSGGLLHTHVIPVDRDNDEALARAGVAQPSFYLLRPDGHVGLAGTHLDAAVVHRYLAERGLRVDSAARNRAAAALQPV